MYALPSCGLSCACPLSGYEPRRGGCRRSRPRVGWSLKLLEPSGNRASFFAILHFVSALPGKLLFYEAFLVAVCIQARRRLRPKQCSVVDARSVVRSQTVVHHKASRTPHGEPQVQVLVAKGGPLLPEQRHISVQAGHGHDACR